VFLCFASFAKPPYTIDKKHSLTLFAQYVEQEIRVGLDWAWIWKIRCYKNVLTLACA